MDFGDILLYVAGMPGSALNVDTSWSTGLLDSIHAP
jgi:hypothetical protein